jgi:hypothetical protein
MRRLAEPILVEEFLHCGRGVPHGANRATHVVTLLRGLVTDLRASATMTAPSGSTAGAGHLRFCRCQYHHMNHASRAHTSQGTKNVTVAP